MIIAKSNVYIYKIDCTYASINCSTEVRILVQSNILRKLGMKMNITSVPTFDSANRRLHISNTWLGNFLLFEKSEMLEDTLRQMFHKQIFVFLFLFLFLFFNIE